MKKLIPMPPNRNLSVFICSIFLFAQSLTGQQNDQVFPGADEGSPSLSQYFSWINNTNEGSTEEQTLINLDFFRCLHDEYGLNLDIYVISAGHPVGFCLYTHGNRQYIAYCNSNRNMVVGQRNLGDEKFERHHFTKP